MKFRAPKQLSYGIGSRRGFHKISWAVDPGSKKGLILFQTTFNCLTKTLYLMSIKLSKNSQFMDTKLKNTLNIIQAVHVPYPQRQTYCWRPCWLCACFNTFLAYNCIRWDLLVLKKWNLNDTRINMIAMLQHQQQIWKC